MLELPHSPGEVISYIEMCQSWTASLQKGMNFHLRPHRSVILMSRRRNAPYRDQITEEGRVLIYEGHDVSKSKDYPSPKLIDQPRNTPTHRLTQNGLFEKAALNAKTGKQMPEVVAVYEKIRDGTWVFNGFFHLVDAWQENDGKRSVFKFRLELSDCLLQESSSEPNLEHSRVIPSSVKFEVWKRDKGRCVLCGSSNNLHFDHELPFSKGGSSLLAANIRILCARHNLSKSDKIE
jgi:hypothetical protein